LSEAVLDALDSIVRNTEEVEKVPLTSTRRSV
jgi:hypothetical protein